MANVPHLFDFWILAPLFDAYPPPFRYRLILVDIIRPYNRKVLPIDIIRNYILSPFNNIKITK